MGDKKFDSIEGVITPCDISFQHMNEFNNYRATIEHVNAMIKNFGCLGSVFRHNHEKHNICFKVICNIVNLMNLEKMK